jgi:hypothetical protein
MRSQSTENNGLLCAGCSFHRTFLHVQVIAELCSNAEIVIDSIIYTIRKHQRGNPLSVQLVNMNLVIFSHFGTFKVRARYSLLWKSQTKPVAIMLSSSRKASFKVFLFFFDLDILMVTKFTSSSFKNPVISCFSNCLSLVSLFENQNHFP